MCLSTQRRYFMDKHQTTNLITSANSIQIGDAIFEGIKQIPGCRHDFSGLGIRFTNPHPTPTSLMVSASATTSKSGLNISKAMPVHIVFGDTLFIQTNGITRTTLIDIDYSELEDKLQVLS